MSVLKDKDALEQAIRQSIAGIDEILAKSGHSMNAKEAPNSEDQGSESLKKMDPNDGLAEEQYESPDEADAEMDAEMGEEVDEDPSAMEGGEDDAWMEEMAQHASMLQPEQLQALIALLSHIQESGMGEEEGMDMGAEEQPEPEMEKNYKEDYLKLTKSVQNSVNKLAGTVEKLSKDVQSMKSGRKVVQNKAAASRRSGQEALEKSAPAAKKVERLNKSETQEFLMNEIRNRNSLVDRHTIINLNYVNDDNSLAKFQDDLTRKGVNFPKL